MLWALLRECEYLNFINNLLTVIYHEQFEFDSLSGFGSSLCYYCFLTFVKMYADHAMSNHLCLLPI